MNLPQELVIKILVEFHGGFSFRNGKLIAKIAKDDPRRRLMFLHPNLKTNLLNQTRVVLRISPTKHYIIAVSYIDHNKVNIVVMLCTDNLSKYNVLLRY